MIPIDLGKESNKEQTHDVDEGDSYTSAEGSG